LPESEFTSDIESQEANIEYRWYSRLGEWYLTVCFAYLLIEAVFHDPMNEMLGERAHWLFRLTPYNLWPSVLYFYGAGFAIGLYIIMTGRKSWHVPIKGSMVYLTIWFVYLGWGLYGGFLRNPWWHRDIRSTILPSIVVPWVVVLAQNVRYEVVLSRICKLCVPFALWNIVMGVLRFATFNPNVPVIIWRGEYMLIFAYIIALAKNMTGAKIAPVSLVILGMGIVAPLHKPVVVTFVVANFIILFLRFRINLPGYSWRTVRTFLVILLLILTLSVFLSYIFNLGGGEAEKWIRHRYLKGTSVGGRDIAGLSGRRIEMWQQCLEWWKQRPVIGKGLGMKLHSPLGPWPLDIHNLPLQTLAQTGLVGFCLVLIAALSWIKRGISTLRYEATVNRAWVRLALLTFSFTILTTTLYGETLSIRSLAFAFWIVAGMETAAHSQLIHWSLQDQLEYEPTTIMTDTFFGQEAF